MTRKWLAVVVLVAVTAGAVFAQDDFKTMPKNTFSVDIGPALIAAGIMAGLTDVGAQSFGIAIQHEVQVHPYFSVGGRFAYLGGGFKLRTEERIDITAVTRMRLDSFSLEGHTRYYIFGNSFFLDGMMGLAYMSATFTGEEFPDAIPSLDKKSFASFASRTYIKLGMKLGWRIDFGKPGGFVFEPSIGYYVGVGLGPSPWNRLTAGNNEDADDLDNMFAYIENLLLAGGPRAALCFGWRL